MSCRFIEKYMNKLYTDEMSYIDRRALNHHMSSCPECSLIYHKILSGNEKIKERVLVVETPPSLMSSVANQIEERSGRRKRNRRLSFKKYIAATVVLILVAASSLQFLPGIFNKNSPAGPSNAPDPNTVLISPNSLLSNSEFQNVLKSYVIEKQGMTSKGGQVFAALDVFGVEEQGGLIDVYLWALIEEYVWVQGLMPGTGSSIPMMVQLKREGSSYHPESYKVPRDGSYFGEDIKVIFPEKYQSKVFARSGNVLDLSQQNKQQAMEYFKNYTIPQNGKGIQPVIVDFLSKYGWHLEGTEYLQKIKIPLSFVDKPGEFPVGIYWAYNNVLSKEIGYDISRYKGMDATAHILHLKEEFGDNPNKLVRAVVIEVSGQIAGAWLDRGRHYAFLAALDKKYFADLAGKSWGQWLKGEGLVDYSETGYEGKLKSLTPEEVIRKYYEAIDKKDYKTAYSLMSKSYQISYLFSNMDDDKLYNDSYESQFGGFSNTTSVKVLKVTESSHNRSIDNDKLLNRKVAEAKLYEADTDMTFKQPITRDNGNNLCFITLVKETSDAPWLIDSIGTGP